MIFLLVLWSKNVVLWTRLILFNMICMALSINSLHRGPDLLKQLNREKQWSHFLMQYWIKLFVAQLLCLLLVVVESLLPLVLQFLELLLQGIEWYLYYFIHIFTSIFIHILYTKAKSTCRYSNIFVTAPSPENLKTLFEFICKGFDMLEYKVCSNY